MITGYTNVQIFQPDGFVPGSLYLQEGKIVAEQKPDEMVDCQGLFLAPGLIDLQVNGIAGYDFTVSLKNLKAASLLLAKTGVTGFLATVLSQPLQRYPGIISGFSAKNSTCLGLHLEGPYLNPLKHGAHPKELVQKRCDVDFWKELLDQSKVKKVTFAPELENGKKFLELLLKRNILPFCGHTEATVEELKRAKGLIGATHLFNAMRPLHQREPGTIGYVLGERKLYYSLIVDEQHLHPDTVALAYNAHPEGLILVSDLRAKTLFGKPVQGLPAGSSTPLLEAVFNLQKQAACPLHYAIMAASTRPAQLLGLGNSKGLLSVGYDADFILFDKKGSLKATYIAGKEVFP